MTVNTDQQSELRIRQRIYNQLSLLEINSSDNRYFAGENVGHEPDDNEAGLHYAVNGAPTFAQRFGFILDTQLSLEQVYQKLDELGVDSRLSAGLFCSDTN